MVNTVQQPGFIGSAPADVVGRAGEQGQGWARLISDAMTSGLAIYGKKQEALQLAEAKKQESDAQAERLRISMIADDLSRKLTEAGSGNEISVLYENKPLFKELFTFYSKGNAELADTMLQSTEGQFMRSAAPTALSKLGMIQVSEEAPEGAAPAAPAVGVEAPVAAPQPEVSAVEAPKPAAAPSAPANPLEANQPLMNMLRAEAKRLYPGESGKIDGLDNAGMLKEYPKTLNGMISKLDAKGLTEILGARAQAEEAGARTSAGAQASASSRLDFSKTALNPAIATSVQETMGRLDEYLKNEGMDFSMTPKEGAATKAAGRYVGKVLKDSPTTKAWIAAGGKEEALQTAADALAKRLTDSPEAAAYFKEKNVFSSKETAEMLSLAKEDRLATDMVNDFALGQDRIKASQMQAALKGYQAMASLFVQSEKTKAAIENAQSKMSATELKLDVEYRKLAQGAAYKLQDAVQKWKDDFAKQKPKATPEQMHDAMNRAFAEDASLKAAWTLAAEAAAKVSGGTAEEVGLQFKAMFMLDLPFDFGIGEKAPAGEAKLPSLQLNPPAKAAPQAPKPAGNVNVDSYVNGLLGGN